jgi:hypothetical protein
MQKFILIALLLIALAACRNGSGNANSNGNESNGESVLVESIGTTTELRFDEPPTVTPTPTLIPAATLPGRDHLGHVSPVSTRTIHIIEPGDTMSEIAAKYNITVEELAAANRHYNFDLILVGDKLYIPPCPDK